MNTVKERLVLMRGRLNNLTQKEAAEKMNLKQQTWAAMEKRSAISNKNAKKIEEVFGVNSLWIMTGKGKMMLDEIEDEEIYYINIRDLSQPKKLENRKLEKSIKINGKAKDKKRYAIEINEIGYENEIPKGSTVTVEKIEFEKEFVTDKLYILIIKNMPYVGKVKMLIGDKDFGKISIEGKTGNEIVSTENIDHWYRIRNILIEV